MTDKETPAAAATPSTPAVRATARRKPAAPVVKTVPHLSPEEHRLLGRSARKSLPRTQIGRWEPSPTRLDPVAVMHAEAESRVPELVPVRNGRMLTSPFAFFRGAAGVMAADLASTGCTSGLTVQLAGDAHLSNFGGFATPERSLVFDLNDFDETLPGPFEWDVMRLVASAAIAGRGAKIPTRQRRGIILGAAATYRRAMAEFAAMSNCQLWYQRLEEKDILARWGSQAAGRQLRTFKQTVAKGQAKDSAAAMVKLTTLVDGHRQLVNNPPLMVRLDDLIGEQHHLDSKELLIGMLEAYKTTLPADRRHLLDMYRPVDTARKVVGVGSVGTRCWVTLLEGRDPEDALFLQIKEAGPSVLEKYLPASVQAQHGQRVVEGQRLMQSAGDPLLGWFSALDLEGIERHYYVRQLWDWKTSADVGRMVASGLAIYARICAWVLARAHARSGDRSAIAGYLGSGEVADNAFADFAEKYADQNDRDYRQLIVAADEGRLPIVRGV
jgi:uncharacterized protein (DUF2252 family)